MEEGLKGSGWLGVRPASKSSPAQRGTSGVRVGKNLEVGSPEIPLYVRDDMLRGSRLG
jgi:hypothetical protein